VSKLYSFTKIQFFSNVVIQLESRSEGETSSK